MMKRSRNCSICEKSNRASVCAGCVNNWLNERNTLLTSLNARRDSLYSRLSELLVEKGKANGQQSWIMLQSEKLAKLREKLNGNVDQLLRGKKKIEKLSHGLKSRYRVLESARIMALENNRSSLVEKSHPNLIHNCCLVHMEITSERLHKQSLVVKQICRLFPLCKATIDVETKDACSGQYDQICSARLPRGLNPHSVPPKELSASLGILFNCWNTNMVQLLNLVVRNLAVPALHNSVFAGSCSRIWQRASYWNARPSSRSNGYPLFIPASNYFTSSENSWTSRSTSNFGVVSLESDRGSELNSSGEDAFNYSSASPRSLEAKRELQKGIALLKKSLACINAYCYNSLYMEVPSESSTFEALAKLLTTLSSSTEVRYAFSSALSRSGEPGQEVNKSIWNLNSAGSSTLLDSSQTLPIPGIKSSISLTNSTASYGQAAEHFNGTKNEGPIDGWDFVEHPTHPRKDTFITKKK